MIITFFGHSSFNSGIEYRERLRVLIDEISHTATEVEFLLGEYGGFDSFAYSVAREYKDKNKSARLTFVTPYIDTVYLKLSDAGKCGRFDSVVYPEIENVPKRFAIFYRNKWMVDVADAVIVFVKHNYGGVYQAYKYAVSKNKRVYNIVK